MDFSTKKTSYETWKVKKVTFLPTSAFLKIIKNTYTNKSNHILATMHG